jgi:hypothetical protein
LSLSLIQVYTCHGMCGIPSTAIRASLSSLSISSKNGFWTAPPFPAVQDKTPRVSKNPWGIYMVVATLRKCFHLRWSPYPANPFPTASRSRLLVAGMGSIHSPPGSAAGVRFILKRVLARYLLTGRVYKI